MRNRVLLAGLSILLLAGCGAIPRDPEGTSAGVAESGVIRLGAIAGAAADPAEERALDRLEAQTGARIERVSGPGEELLEKLEIGEIDLVYGRFADDSPWATHVHLGTPPGGPDKPPKSLRVPRFAFRNGENGWITRVEAAAK